MATEPLDLLSPEQRASLTEDLRHWEPLSAEDAYRVMSSPLLANDSPFFRRVLALETEVESLRELTSTCTCYDGNSQNYEGPEADCAVHGAVRAFNEAQSEIAGLRLDLATLQRTLCELSTPTKPKDGAL